MNQYVLRISLRSNHCLFYEDVEALPLFFRLMSLMCGVVTHPRAKNLFQVVQLLRRYDMYAVPYPTS